MMPGEAPLGEGEGLADDAGDLPANAKMCARGERRLRCSVEIGDSLGIGCGIRCRGETKHVTVFSRHDAIARAQCTQHTASAEYERCAWQAMRQIGVPSRMHLPAYTDEIHSSMESSINIEHLRKAAHRRLLRAQRLSIGALRGVRRVVHFRVLLGTEQPVLIPAQLELLLEPPNLLPHLRAFPILTRTLLLPLAAYSHVHIPLCCCTGGSSAA